MMILVALLTSRRHWFLVPALMLLGAAIFRILAWLVRDASFAGESVALEMVVACLLFLSCARLASESVIMICSLRSGGALLSSVLAALWQAPLALASRPNIVLVLADDLGFSDIAPTARDQYAPPERAGAQRHQFFQLPHRGQLRPPGVCC